MSEGTQRKLTAIVLADVVGYSSLMQADEAGTHQRWTERYDCKLEDTMIHSRCRIGRTTK